MSYQIQIRRDRLTNWLTVNPLLAQGELGHESDTNRLKIGDGANPWSTLPYFWDPSGFVSSSRVVGTTGSLIGGGNLTSDLSLSLANDNATPGNLYYYGTNSSGIKGFYTVASAAPAAVPAGSDKQVQFNDGGSAFGGASGMSWNKTTNVATITGMDMFVGTGSDLYKVVIQRSVVGGTIEIRGNSTENTSAYFQACGSASPESPGQVEVFFYRDGTPFSTPYSQNAALFGGYNASTDWTAWMHCASDNTVQVNCDDLPTSLSGDSWGQFGWGRNFRSALSANTAINHALAVKADSGMAKAMAIMPTARATANDDTLIGLDVQPRWVDSSYTGVRHQGLLIRDGFTGLGMGAPSQALEVNGNVIVRARSGLELLTNGSFGTAALLGWTATGSGWAPHAADAIDPFNSAYHTGGVSGTLTHTVAPLSGPGQLYSIRFRLSAIPVPFFDILGTSYTNGNLNGGSGVGMTIGGVTLTTRTHEGYYEELFSPSNTNTLVITTSDTVAITDISVQLIGSATVTSWGGFAAGQANQFTVDSSGNIGSINGVSYTWPGANATGVLTNNGSGTLSWSAVTLANMASIADQTLLGNNSGTTAAPIALTATQVTAMLNDFTSLLAGLTPASGGGTTNFLRADGSWNNVLSTISVANSITNNGVTTLTLVNDTAAPGNSYYYGTDGSGTKGYFTLPTGGSIAGTDTQIQYNNSGAFGASSMFTINKTSGAILLAGAWATGTGTTAIPELLINPSAVSPATTWSTDGTSLGINSAGGFTGNLLDLKLNNSSKMSVSYTGDVYATRLIKTISTLTDGSTIATDCSLGDAFRITLTASGHTLSNPSSAYDGQRVIWEIIQGGSGSNLLVLDTKFIFGTDITSISLSATVGKRDFLGAFYNSGTDKWYVTAFVAGY